MDVYQTIIALTLAGGLIVAYKALSNLLTLLDGHLERLQGKLDVLLAAQTEQNAQIAAILLKLF